SDDIPVGVAVVPAGKRPRPVRDFPKGGAVAGRVLQAIHHHPPYGLLADKWLSPRLSVNRTGHCLQVSETGHRLAISFATAPITLCSPNVSASSLGSAPDWSS